MMSERFVIGDDNIAMFEVIDMNKEELVCECRAVDVEKLCYLLNELNDENKTLKKENEWLRKELKGLNKKYIAFSEATDKRLREMMK